MTNDEEDVVFLPAITEKEGVSRGRSLATAPLRGWAEQVISHFGFESPQEAAKRIRKTPRQTRAQQIISELDKVLPQREGAEEELLQKFGGYAGIPMPGMGPLEQLFRSLGAATLSQTAKETGGGPLAQALAEIPAWGLPHEIPKTLIPPKGQEELYKTLEGYGLSPETITRSIQSRRKAAFLGKVAAKGPRAQEAMESTRDELGNFYDLIRSNPEASKPIDESIVRGLVEEWLPIAKDMPAASRNIIKEDVQQLLSEPVTPDSLMRFWRQINQVFRGKGKDLQRFKTGIDQVIYSQNPGLGEMFDVFNNMYSQFSNLSSHLHPKMHDEFVDIANMAALGQGVVTGNNGLLQKALAAMGIRKTAQELLISPRLQSIGRKFLKAAASKSLKTSASLARTFKTQFEKENNIRDEVNLPQVLEFND